MEVKGKKKLSNVTLVCVSDISREQTIEAIETCKSYFDFANIKLFTSKFLDYEHAVKVPPIESLARYNEFILKNLVAHIDTSHALIVQWDGFIVNPELWTDDYLKYDYIGAPCASDALKTQNGGFSLRSKKLMQEVCNFAQYGVGVGAAEDAIINHYLRIYLEEKGYKFAPYEVATRFSSEYKSVKAFGFHNFRLNPQVTFKKMYNSVNADNQWNPNDVIAFSNGHIGDIIYSIPTAKELGITQYLLDISDPASKFKHESYRSIKPLLESQGFEVKLYKGQPIYSPHYDFGAFNRWADYNEKHLTRCYADAFGINLKNDYNKPFLDFPETKIEHDIAVSVTSRYHEFNLNYYGLLYDFQDRDIVFVGSGTEFKNFKKQYQYLKIEHISTCDMVDVCKVIQSSKVFIGNAGGNMAIAQALAKPILMEHSVYTLNATPQNRLSYCISQRNQHSGYPKDRLLEFLELYDGKEV